MQSSALAGKKDATAPALAPTAKKASSPSPSPSPSSSRPKPKRPLSGYNLFYRYKRNMVLEATSRLQRCGGVPASPADEQSVINSVLVALPGLEGVHPGHVIWSLPPASIDELRASNIRMSMEGKLLPNELASRRLHRKVHGMGFVEMGRIMRETWAATDPFTKEVFAQLADVGRAKYKDLLAEYKLNSGEMGAPTVMIGNGKDKVKDKEVTRRVKVRPASVNATLVSAVAVANHPAPPKTEATPKAPLKPSVECGLVTPMPSSDWHQAAFSRAVSSHCPPYSRQGSNSSDPQASIVSAGSMRSPNGGCLDSLEPLSLQTQRYERRVSNNFLDSAASSPMLSSSVGGQGHHQPLSFRSRQDVNDEFQRLLKTSVIPALPILPPPFISPRNNMMMSPGQGSNVGVVSPSSSGLSWNEAQQMRYSLLSGSIPGGLSGGGSTPITRNGNGVSTNDLLELIGTLDEALDDGGAEVMSPPSVGDDCCPSMIFGKPIHDVEMQLYGATMPEGFSLNKARAKMA